MKQDILVYLKDGEISLWQKHYIWHKWMPETPKAYADVMFTITKDKSAYGPTFWGMHDEPPEEKGYTFIGKLDLR